MSENTGSTLPEAARALIDAPEFATVATIEEDGRPQQSVVWVDRDDNTILFTVQAFRRKARNLARDPRVSVLIVPQGSPYTYLEVRGTAVLEDGNDQVLLNKLAVKYTGQPYPPDPPGTERLTVRVIPERVFWYAE